MCCMLSSATHTHTYTHTNIVSHEKIACVVDCNWYYSQYIVLKALQIYRFHSKKELKFIICVMKTLGKGNLTLTLFYAQSINDLQFTVESVCMLMYCSSNNMQYIYVYYIYIYIYIYTYITYIK